MIAVDVKLFMKKNLFFTLIAFSFLFCSVAFAQEPSKAFEITYLSFGSDKGKLSTVSKNGLTNLWQYEKSVLEEAKTGESVKKSDISEYKTKYADKVVGSINCIAVSKDEKFVAVSTKKGFIKIFDQNDEEYQLIEVYSGVVTAAEFSFDSKLLYAGFKDGLVHVYDVLTGALKAIIKGDSVPVSSLAVSPGNRHYAAGYKNGVVMVWESDSNQNIATLFNADAGSESSSESTADKIYNFFDLTSFRAIGGFYNQELPVAVENDYIDTKLGFGVTYEQKLEGILGYSGTFTWDFGVRNVDLIYLWMNMSLDGAVFVRHNFTEKLALQPEMHLGFNFNTVMINTDVAEWYKPCSLDFMMMPAVAVQYQLTDKHVLDGAVYTKFAFEQKDCIVNLGYRIGYRYRF